MQIARKLFTSKFGELQGKQRHHSIVCPPDRLHGFELFYSMHLGVARARRCIVVRALNDF